MESRGELDLSTRGNYGQGQNSRTPPNCARCRNHEIILPLKGHKRYCKFINCNCEKCKLTAERQKVMARQTAIRRAEEQDRQRLSRGLPVPGGAQAYVPPGPSPPPEAEASNSSAQDGSVSGSSLIAPALTVPEAVPSSPSTPTSKLESTNSRQSGRDHWNSICLLLKLCQLPDNNNITPLLHIILTDINPNPSEVYDRYRQAREELQSTPCPVKEERRPLEIFPWYCHSNLPQPTAIRHSALPYSALNLTSTMRYHPYGSYGPILSPYSRSMRSFDTILPYPISMHETPRPLITHERYDSQTNYRPASPASVQSDKSSYSPGSVDI